MAGFDARTISGGTPGEVLMERAGDRCHREAIVLAGGVYGSRFCVLAGPGNNGGDGFVVARLLRRAGAQVRCVFAAENSRRERISGDAALNLERMEAVGVPLEDFTGDLPACEVVVDAIFGTGFAGAAHGAAGQAMGSIPAGAAVLSVDIPSGVDGSTGMVTGPAVRADVTVAVQALKVGHVLEPGAERSGRLVVADIGIEVDEPDASLSDPHEAVGGLPERGRLAHKWSAGSVLVLGGSPGMGGAPTLSSLAAVRAGAGLVSACVPQPVQPQVAGAVPEVMVVPLPCDEAGHLTEVSFGHVPRPQRFGSLAVGPGLGRSEGVSRFVRKAMYEVPQPMVLDADGLNAVSGEDLRARTGPTVITPHDGEFTRLGGDLTGPASRIAAAAVAAAEWDATVLLKGPSTLVASPGRRPVVCRGGGPELATAGTGDTLTGIVAAFLARGSGPHEAAVAAVAVHAEAGRRAAADGRWVSAIDLHEYLGAAERGLR